MKAKFTKGKIKRSGVYLFKPNVEDDDYEILFVKNYRNRVWATLDYPCANVAEPFANDGTRSWVKLE